jgi:nitroimidazol reductase NimA-like FMN-containing flavoprotein (pyridoxamine 5'-phosphate oxidase superfamily)
MAVESADELKSQISELLAGEQLAVLATRTDGAPHTSLVAFRVSADLRHLFFVTGRATRKFNFLQSDNRASLLIDNRSHQSSDFRLAMALTARGRVKEVNGKGHMAMLTSYVERFPCLEEFARSPGTALMCLQVDRYSLVRRFQDVVELIF